MLKIVFDALLLCVAVVDSEAAELSL